MKNIYICSWRRKSCWPIDMLYFERWCKRRHLSDLWDHQRQIVVIHRSSFGGFFLFFLTYDVIFFNHQSSSTRERPSLWRAVTVQWWVFPSVCTLTLSNSKSLHLLTKQQRYICTTHFFFKKLKLYSYGWYFIFPIEKYMFLFWVSCFQSAFEICHIVRFVCMRLCSQRLVILYNSVIHWHFSMPYHW